MIQMPMIQEPKNGCEILCEVDVNFATYRDVRVYTVTHPRMLSGWRISCDADVISDVSDWNGVLTFLRNLHADILEVHSL